MADDPIELLNALKALLRRSESTWTGAKERKRHLEQVFRLQESLKKERITYEAIPHYFNLSKPGRVKIPSEGKPNEVFLLPYLKGAPAFIPLLGMDWDFDGGHSPGKFTLCFVPAKKPSAGSGAGGRALILRYEPQEGAGSAWEFAHVQSCAKEPLHQGYRGYETVEVSDELPRIPLAGVHLDAAGLLLTIVASLYGITSQVWVPEIPAHFFPKLWVHSLPSGDGSDTMVL